MKSEVTYKDCLWSESESHFAIPGPWRKATSFYLDVRTGECILPGPNDAYHTQEDLTEEDIIRCWEQVEKVDRAEIKQFVDEQVFRKRDYIGIDIGTIDAIWVRKWKQLADGAIIVKSRFCVRGFLGPQRPSMPTRSTTASRLSHRIFFLCVRC